jgi:cyclophilin family peptidyl-prolyl cis-trans isomerase
MMSVRIAALCALVAASALAAEKPRVTLDTSHGVIVLELDREKAPITVDNFLKYVEDGHYTGTVFHRVIADFMIQGGGFDDKMTQKKTRDPIKNESDNGLLNKRGTIAMARTREPDSASAQFFINTKDNAFLDRANAQDRVGYCVFGAVVEGLDVVDKIRAVKTGRVGPHGDVPVEPVVIKGAKVTAAGK